MSTMALKLPMNYVNVNENEMEYIDGGEITIISAAAMIASLAAAGYSVLQIGEKCGQYIYQNGGSRNGLMAHTFKLASVTTLGPIGVAFSIGLDNGWVAASKK
jgi:hypothetical protein